MRVERTALAFLEAHGAGAIENPGGTLIAHLCRTADLLVSWGASPALTVAGLCHATYGTDGFPTALLPTSRRGDLVAVIGATAEAIVYLSRAATGECSSHSSVATSRRGSVTDSHK